MSIAHLADTGLPFNRKERFFTGTVLPMLVCADDFAHFGRLTDLVGLGRIDVDARPASLGAQAALVRYIARRLDVEPAGLAHVALLPAALASAVGSLSVPSVTWEQLAATYADVAPPYFLEVLRVALARYDQLVAHRAAFGENAEMKLRGDQLLAQHRAGTLVTPWMGRRGGLAGAELAKDIASGTWRGQLYECSSKPVQNPSWFTVAELAARVAATPSTASSSRATPTSRPPGAGGGAGKRARKLKSP
ncbi:MAG: hypothetical protein IT372_25345 [Polyangiaceae bacterium]|nr:hypothetical protein [Polyangiaceae bacterium]